jgi:hypothetical protein
MGVPSATRWLLSWLPESGEPENLDEWARSNLYLIPPKPQKQQTAAAVAQQQRYASRWPPARPGRAPMHGMPQGSPYGRFGKSFPPSLPAPLERREEEEREQEESSHRGLKRVHSSSGAVSEPKRQSFERQQDACSSGGSGDAERRSTPPAVRQWRATPPLTIPGQSSGSSGVEQSGRRGERQLRHLSMENCNEGRQHRNDCMSGVRTNLAAADAAGRRAGGGAAAVGDTASLSRLLDDTVQLLGQSSLVRQPSAPAIMMHHTCSATVRALNASLSSGSLAAQAAEAQAAGMEGIEEAPLESEAPAMQQDRRGLLPHMAALL